MFGFGIETEYLLVRSADRKALSHHDLSFDELHHILESIPLEGIPNLDSLDLEDFHRNVSPYVIEGYALWDGDSSQAKINGFIPKGIEIRTPVAHTIDDSLTLLESLFQRLQDTLSKHGLKASAISHHPVEHSFKGPRGNRIETWMSAQNAMTSFGPDINISMPEELFNKISASDYEEKFNYYAAPMIAWALSSPFKNNHLWKMRDTFGRSYRTFKRSADAPAIKRHLGRNPRFEFKAYEMNCSLDDFKNYILLFMTVLLDDQLAGRSSRSERIFELKDLAVNGLELNWACDKLSEILERALHVLPQWGINPKSLERVSKRLEERKTPADEMIEAFLKQEQSIACILEAYSQLQPLSSQT